MLSIYQSRAWDSCTENLQGGNCSVTRNFRGNSMLITKSRQSETEQERAGGGIANSTTMSSTSSMGNICKMSTFLSCLKAQRIRIQKLGTLPNHQDITAFGVYERF